MQTQTCTVNSAMPNAASFRWLPPELIDTVWEFCADPRCSRGAALHGRRFPAEKAPTATEMGCCGRSCRCGYRVVM